MNKAWLLMSIVVAVAAGVVAVRYQALRQSQAEQTRLRQQLAEVAELRAAVAEKKTAPPASAKAILSSIEQLELLRLRNQVGQLRRKLAAESNQMSMNVPPANLPGAADSTGGQIDVSAGIFSLKDARDVGAATGEALMQTTFWAMHTGNIERLLHLCDFDTEAERTRIEKEWLSQRVATGGMNRPPKDFRCRVVRQVVLDDGDSAIVMEVGRGNDTGREALRIRRVGDEWRVVIGENGDLAKVRLNEELMRD